jgi:Flp pilus assembly protein TadD
MTTHVLVRAIRRTVLAASVALAFAAPAFAVDSGSDDPSIATAPDLSQVRVLINNADFVGAVAALKPIVAQHPDDPDALNLMGYSLRKSGDVDRAYGFYRKALNINPRHRGANEYLGELYVEIGEIEKAKEHLLALERICGNTSCEEYVDLAEAIAAL